MAAYDIGDQITVRARFGLNVTSLKARSLAGALTVQVYSVTGYANGDDLILNAGELTEETVEIASITGLTVTLSAALSFTHEPGESVAELTDPSTVTLKHKLPDGTINSYTYAGGTVTKDSTGIYSKNLSLADDGEHFYRFVGTGTVETAEEKRFTVRPSEFS